MNYDKIKKQIEIYISSHSAKRNKYYLFKYRQHIKNEYRCRQMKLCSQYRLILANKPAHISEYSRRLCLLIKQYRPILTFIDNIEIK